jgi:hypothetical protein
MKRVIAMDIKRQHRLYQWKDGKKLELGEKSLVMDTYLSPYSLAPFPCILSDVCISGKTKKLELGEKSWSWVY